MLSSRWLVSLPVLVVLAFPAFGQDDLKWKFTKDKPFYQEMTTETKQEMKVTGMTINQNQKQTFYFSWTPKEKDKDGNQVVTQKIEGVKIDIVISGNNITFDSTKEAGASNPLTEFFKALVGSEFKLTLDKDMKVTKIEGRKEFLEKLIQTNQQMKQLLESILSEEALKQMADPAFAVVPDKPVKKGDTWKKESRLNMGPIGSYENTHKYTHEGPDEKEKKLYKIKVDTTLKYIPPGPNIPPNFPFKITKADLSSKEAGGTILFDNEKGRVASSTMNVKLAGTLSIEIGGMTSEVTLNQDQTTTVKTTDENPIKKGS